MSSSRDILHASLSPAQGFHPTLVVEITLPHGIRRARAPMMGQTMDTADSSTHIRRRRPLCELYIAQTLPSDVFVDTHELELRKDEYMSTVHGENNLELPVYEMEGRGQELLLHVPTSVVNATQEENSTHRLEVPLHLRYSRPEQQDGGGGGYTSIEIGWPEAFWSCSSNGASKGESLQVNSLPHSFRSSFSTSTLFRITPAPEVSHTLTVQAPVGNLDDLRFVETGTALVILACFAYLARVAWHAFRQLGAEATMTGSSGARHAKVD